MRSTSIWFTVPPTLNPDLEEVRLCATRQRRVKSSAKTAAKTFGFEVGMTGSSWAGIVECHRRKKRVSFIAVAPHPESDDPAWCARAPLRPTAPTASSPEVLDQHEIRAFTCRPTVQNGRSVSRDSEARRNAPCEPLKF